MEYNNIILQTLREKKISLENQINEIDKAINTILLTNSGKSLDNKTLSSYDELPKLDNQDKSIKSKISEVLKAKNRFMHIRELANKIRINDGQPEDTLEDYIKKVSAKLTLLKKDNKIASFSINGQLRNTVWAKWLNSDGNIIPGHENDSEFIKNNDDVGNPDPSYISTSHVERQNLTEQS